MTGGNMNGDMDVDTYMTKVELSFRAEELVNMDYFSKSDPFVVVYVNQQQQEQPLMRHEVFRTEVIQDNLSPQWANTFIMDYRFEEEQVLYVEVYDADSESAAIEDHDFIGRAEFKLGDIVSSAGSTKEKTLRMKGKENSRGILIVSAEEVADMKHTIIFDISCKKLHQSGWFTTTSPFIEISRVKEDGSYQLVYRSQKEKSTASPCWSSFVLGMQKLCNGDHCRPLMFTVKNFSSNGAHTELFSVQTSVNDLLKGLSLSEETDTFSSKTFPLSHKGQLTVKTRVVKEHSFLDYIRGGCEINLHVAIDFTGSNGKPELPQSLHYNGGQKPNEYVDAITSVAKILETYDSDQMIPSVGFGARLRHGGPVSHCFPLVHGQVELHGVDGVLSGYFNALNSIELYGPTLFGPILSHFRDLVLAGDERSQQNQKYDILLIICDGKINDMDQAVDLIVDLSYHPCSIVIVGVGNADFSDMERLDADDVPLVSTQGRKQWRDIVQFVPLRQFRSRHGCVNATVAQATLAEIPEQLTSYFQEKNIVPFPPTRYVPQQVSEHSRIHPVNPAPYNPSFVPSAPHIS